MTRFVTRLLAPAFGAALLLSACGGDPAPAVKQAPTMSATPAAAPTAAVAAVAQPLPGDPAKGEAVYKANCIACHQADGTGMGGALAADFVKDASRLAKSNDVLLKSIAEGVPGTTMIAWGAIVDEQGRKDVLSYIRATFGPK